VKALKIAAIGLAVLLLVAAIALAVAVARIDPNDYKPHIVQLVKDRTGRKLTLGGPIRLSLFPSVGAAVDKVALSGPGGAGEFASVSTARVSMKLLPLVFGQMVVDELKLTGLTAELVRYKDGRTNYADLLGEPAKQEPRPAGKDAAPSGGTPLAGLDIGGISIKDSRLVWRDEAAGTDLRVSGLDLRTDRIANDVPGRMALTATIDGAQPKLALTLSASSGYRADFDKRAIALSGLDVKLSGTVPGAAGLDATLKGDAAIDAASSRVALADFVLRATSKDGLAANLSVPSLVLAPDRAQSKAIEGALKIDRPEQKLDARLAVDAATLQGSAVEFPRLAIDLDATQAGLGVRGRVGGPARLDLAERKVAAPKLEGTFDVTGPALPPGGVKLAMSGSAEADWGRQTGALQLAAKLDDASIQARAKLARFSPPALSFDVQADRLNVDRYFPPAPAAAPATKGTAPGGGGAAGAAEKPIDLSALRALEANGSVRVGALKVARVELANLAMTVKAAGGRLDANPVSANLYEGTLAASATVSANDNAYVLRSQLANVSVGPLLRDLAQKDVLEGRGNVSLDVRGTGTTPTAIKRSLGGSAAVALHDGAVKGVNIADILRKAKAALGSRSALEELSRGGEKTDFTEMTATFAIRDGVARNDDLAAKSPLLRVAGAGSIDIAAGALDYTVRATVVDTSGGQGGKDLDQLRGITVPVRLVGPFDAIGYQVDVVTLAAELAKSEAGRRLEERLLGTKPGAAGGAIDALRGLFGGKR
jgi:AsmA protein